MVNFSALLRDQLQTMSKAAFVEAFSCHRKDLRMRRIPFSFSVFIFIL